MLLRPGRCSGCLAVSSYLRVFVFPRSDPERSAPLLRPVMAHCVTPHLHEDGKAKRGENDPDELTAQNAESPAGKEFVRFQRRNDNGTKGSEITVIMKRREEGDAQSPVGHRVQEAVRRGTEKKVEVEPVPEGAGRLREQPSYDRPG